MAVHVDRSLRLPETEFFPEVCRKTGIALHHTVCDSARRTVDLWRGDRARQGGARRVATAFIIDRDGTTFEVFDPAAWAWQFGLPWRGDQRIPFEKRFIGIEIASEGGLVEKDGRLYAYDQVSPLLSKPPGEAFDCGTPYRGYRWFDRYSRRASSTSSSGNTMPNSVWSSTRFASSCSCRPRPCASGSASGPADRPMIASAVARIESRAGC